MGTRLFVHLFLSAWSVSHAYQVNEREPLLPPLRPGDLLRSLDELTSDAQVIYSPLESAPPPGRTADRRVYDEETPYDHPDSESEYDYDKAYEDFVSKYFAQGEHDLEPEDEDETSLSDDHAAAFDAPEEPTEADDPGPKKGKSKSKICERVQIDDQNCVVCEDPSSNEKSKSCSYSSEPKAKSYGFSRERSHKRSNIDDEGDGDNDETAEAGRSLKRETAPSNGRIQARRTTVPAGSSNKENAAKCTRRREDGMICFYCGSPSSSTRECVADKNSPKKSRLDESTKKDSKSKKIFKRMVTYSYKSDGKPRIEEKTYAALKGY